MTTKKTKNKCVPVPKPKKASVPTPLPKTLIALDYDGTCTTNIPFWVTFIKNAEAAGFEIAIVTMRYAHEKEMMDDRILEVCPWVITTGRKAKHEFCANLGIHPAIWIDDNPLWIYMDAAPAEPIKELESED